MHKKILAFTLVCLLSYNILIVSSKGDPVATEQPVVLTPCGNVTGIKINIDGAIVVGVSNVNNQSPAQNSGIKKGDIVTYINNCKITSIDKMVEIVESSQGKPLNLQYTHNDADKTSQITPVFSNDDKCYKLGIWVKENASGIGTVTFYDPKNGNFGALGHPITEAETGEILKVNTGDAMETKLTGIEKGKVGEPGELKGIFSGIQPIGQIKNNTPFGVFGTFNAPPTHNAPIPIAYKNEITTGKASILAEINHEPPKEYDVEITRIIETVQKTNKSMVIEITDPQLLAVSGGIVQGMSGCPILQNGKLVGAITHVFINDPTRGYGIFIENML